MLRRVGAWLVDDNRHAFGVVLFCTLLTVFVTRLSISNTIIGISIAMVILRRGPLLGFYLLFTFLLITLVSLAIPQQFIKFSTAAGTNTTFQHIAFWFPVVIILYLYMAAILLRRFGSWTVTIEITTGLILLALFLIQIIPSAQTLWNNSIGGILTQLTKNTNSTTLSSLPPQFLTIIFPKLMLGIIGGFVIGMNTFVYLIVARGWTALLCSPGSFGQEFSMIRMSKIMSSILLIVVISIGFYPHAFISYLPYLPSLLLPSIIVGISLTYYFFKTKRVKKPLVFLSIVILFLLSIATIFSFFLLSCIDSWFSLRRKEMVQRQP